MVLFYFWSLKQSSTDPRLLGAQFCAINDITNIILLPESLIVSLSVVKMVPIKRLLVLHLVYRRSPRKPRRLVLGCRDVSPSSRTDESHVQTCCVFLLQLR